MKRRIEVYDCDGCKEAALAVPVEAHVYDGQYHDPCEGYRDSWKEVVLCPKCAGLLLGLLSAERRPDSAAAFLKPLTTKARK